jgi:hypothetical protein
VGLDLPHASKSSDYIITQVAGIRKSPQLLYHRLKDPEMCMSNKVLGDSNTEVRPGFHLRTHLEQEWEATKAVREIRLPALLGIQKRIAPPKRELH